MQGVQGREKCGSAHCLHLLVEELLTGLGALMRARSDLRLLEREAPRMLWAAYKDEIDRTLVHLLGLIRRLGLWPRDRLLPIAPGRHPCVELWVGGTSLEKPNPDLEEIPIVSKFGARPPSKSKRAGFVSLSLGFVAHSRSVRRRVWNRTTQKTENLGLDGAKTG